MRRLKIKKGLSVVVVLVMVLAAVGWAPKVFAGTLVNTSILELGSGASFANPMIASDAQQIAIQFKLATASPTSGTIAFSAGTATSGSIPITGTGCTSYFSGDTAITGSPTATGSGSTISISTLSGLSSTTVTYCALVGNGTTAALTNPVAGAFTATMTLGSDSQVDALDALASGANVYSITGTVAPTFTLALGGASDTFPSNLSASALTVSNGMTVTIGTNAATGWFVWAEDSNVGLKSTANGHTISSLSTSSNHTMNGGTIGTEAYVLGVSANNTANYAYSSGTAGGGLSSTAYNEIATSTTPISSASPAFTAHELADISSTTPAATDYTDTITIIGAGSF